MDETDDPNDATPTLTYEGGFEAVVKRMQARQDPLSFSKSETLPALDIDLKVLKLRTVQEIAPNDVPRFKYQSGNTRKSLELNTEFLGKPELCKLHGLLIAHLRKSRQPSHTMDLFTRIWAEEAEFLFQHLDARWLVSAITTFGDHGKTEIQRRVGQSMTVLFGAMKLYETERLYSGFAPEDTFRLKRLVNRKLPLKMDRYALVGGGLDVNTLGRIWVDAKDDPVIAPLAHHLLDLLNADPGTVFRRFAILRGRKIRQRAQKERARKDVKPAVTPPTQAAPAFKAHSWGIVSTIKASVPQIERFIAHHLALGVDHIAIYLDAPLSSAELTRLEHPKVTLTQCDDAYWQATGKPVFEHHQQRQAFNATQAYRSANTAWLAHIDCDEFIYSSKEMNTVLRDMPKDIDAVIMPPAEELAAPQETDALLFRRTFFDAGCNKSVLEPLYPTFGPYLRSGFISHTLGKTIARTGLSDARFSLHFLKRHGVEVKNTERIQDINVLHRHAPDLETFERHLDFRLQKGSYRKRGKSELGLGDIIDVLREEHGNDGAKTLFEEVCVARPDVIKSLESNGMLIRTTRNTPLSEVKIE